MEKHHTLSLMIVIFGLIFLFGFYRNRSLRVKLLYASWTLVWAGIALLLGCAPCDDDAWKIDLVETEVQAAPGRDCGHVDWIQVTIDDPCGAPVVREDPDRWTCAAGDDQIVCTSSLGVDLGTFTLTLTPTRADLALDDQCRWTFGPR